MRHRPREYPAFRLSASPLDVFSHPTWRCAEAELLASVAEGDRVLLYGEPGTGKTMLLNSLCARLRAIGTTVRRLGPADPEPGRSQSDVLLVDEADRLSDAEIRCLCQLPNPLVLAGLPHLRDRVAPIVGLIGGVSLERLVEDDVARFVDARLAASKRACGAFTPAAALALARHSGGLFRDVVILAGAGLFFAELRGSASVMPEDVAEAAAMRISVASEVSADRLRPHRRDGDRDHAGCGREAAGVRARPETRA